MNESTHILNQIMMDEKKEDKPLSSVEFANKAYEAYLNTLNNEDEKKYLNNEDERVGKPIETLYPNEFGFKVLNLPIAFFGNCKRNLFFKLTGAFKEDTKISEIESIERIMLMKEQWRRKFKFLDLLKDEEKAKAKFKFLGDQITIETNDEGKFTDYVEQKDFTLMIKPINDSAFTLKDKVLSEKGTIMWEHLAEVIVTMFSKSRAVKLLYVGKNNSDVYKEYNIGSKNGFLTINNEIIKDIVISKINKEYEAIKVMFSENLIPPRDYIRPRSLEINEIEVLNDLGVIMNNKDEREYIAGKIYTPFRCTICKYKSICDTLPDGWVNREA